MYAKAITEKLASAADLAKCDVMAAYLQLQALLVPLGAQEVREYPGVPPMDWQFRTFGMPHQLGHSQKYKWGKATLHPPSS